MGFASQKTPPSDGQLGLEDATLLEWWLDYSDLRHHSNDVTGTRYGKPLR